MLDLLNRYLRESFSIAFNEVPRSEDFLLPPRAKSVHQQKMEKFFNIEQRFKESGKARQFFEQPSGNPESGKEGTSVIGRSRAGVPQHGMAEKMMLSKQKNAR